MDVDLSNFEREDFTIDGFYRALVEDNADPQGAGRLRVRILGIHGMDMLGTPTENLPWAEPVLPIAHSGGAANQHIDFGVPIKKIPKTKYKPTPIGPPLIPQLPLPIATDLVNAASTEAVTLPTHRDFAVANSGTGGHFAVPAKGSLVWIFFDGGCHLRPQYFAMATQARDWTAQKLKIAGELLDRDNSIAKISTLLTAKDGGIDPLSHTFTGTATKPATSTPTGAIATGIKPPVHTPAAPIFTLSAKSENLSSWTSPGGTTIFTDHSWRNEQLYIMHKGYSQHIDAKGNVTKIVGTTSKTPTTVPTSLNPVNASGLANDEVEINAGLKSIYIAGDYNIFVNGNCNIQCAQKVTINALADVGIVSRRGNVNVLAELGGINLESKTGTINLKGLNIQLEADNQIVLKSKTKIDLNSLADINISSTKSVNLESTTIQNNAKATFGVQSNSSISMNSNGLSNYTSIGKTVLSAADVAINGNASVLLTSAILEAKATGDLTLQGATVNVLGAAVSVTASGVVNILGATTNVYGSTIANLGGAQKVNVGGAFTTVTGVVTLGLPGVAPATAAAAGKLAFSPPPIVEPVPIVPPVLVLSSPGVSFPAYISKQIV